MVVTTSLQIIPFLTEFTPNELDGRAGDDDEAGHCQHVGADA